MSKIKTQEILENKFDTPEVKNKRGADLQKDFERLKETSSTDALKYLAEHYDKIPAIASEKPLKRRRD